ncbi:MAG: 2-hydroxyacid dehydrogenase [Alphaproteobacteria bacterium]|jgi:lactate dehydrogenase-like 2-hydroxyacid dehydrogenase|nr:2-hydroxyacid dehydrogenase [Alphaproteobacteria bacterium]
MAQEVLVMGPIPAAQLEQLEKNYRIHKLWQAENPEAKLNEVRNNITGMVSTAFFGVTAKIIRALPNLEIISHFGVGYDSVDVKAAKEQGIIVTNTPDVLTDDTADIGIALTLAVFRRTVEGDIYVRSGQWLKKGPMPLGRSLRGKTMGIIGLGRIGQAIAKRAEAFGLEIIYHGPRDKKVSYPYFANLEDMAAKSDILMVACPYTTDTHHLVDAKVLKALGREGVLVNIARGKIVDEKALVDALEAGGIAGAGLDVFEKEPDVPSALCRLDNVVLQPHVGSATHETRGAMAQLVVDNLVLYFEKAEVLTPV